MIAVFGASLTQQKTGYATLLSSHLNEEVSVFGFGGMHISNAGICYIDQVLKARPEYCFLDWFSTGYLNTDEETIVFINTLIHRLVEIKCKPIFLFFSHKQHEKRIDFYQFCKNHLERKEVSYFDLTDFVKFSTTLFRDDVHTTELGSETYANIISQWFMQHKESVQLPQKIEATRFSAIQNKTLNHIYTKSLKLRGNARVVGFLLTVGPHSGILKTDAIHYPTFNTWDEWCYYTRKQMFLSFDLVGDITFRLYNDSFDTSSCKYKDIDFHNIKKMLIVHSIYYIGDLNLSNNWFATQKAKFKYWHWQISIANNQRLKKLKQMASTLKHKVLGSTNNKQISIQ